MTQYQLTLESASLQRLFAGDGQLGRLVEAVLNQVLNAQVTEQLQAAPYERSDQRQGYRNGYKPRQLTTRVGARPWWFRRSAMGSSRLGCSRVTSAVSKRSS